MRPASAASSRGLRVDLAAGALDAGLLLLLFLIVVAVVVAVVTPLRNPSREREADARADRVAELELRKETKYAEIRDAQADFHAGKLSDEDYRTLDRALRREAIAILEQIDRVAARSPEENGPSG
jgi:flagellar biosynthesis/type III secretory pathway M-ring protein FliF/YscJ